jgi:hypothetical protein
MAGETDLDQHAGALVDVEVLDGVLVAPGAARSRKSPKLGPHACSAVLPRHAGM